MQLTIIHFTYFYNDYILALLGTKWDFI